jgi:hypothetical protein
VSADGGQTFDAGALIGTVEMEDAALGPGDAVTVIGTGAGFTGVQAAPTRRLATGSGFFDLAVGAGPSGRGWVAWDSNGPNRTVRAVRVP